MFRRQPLLSLSIFLGAIACPSLIGTASLAGVSETGGKGAQIYCFMRSNGNEHEVSWNAAYAVIKRQTNSLFKTSPRHAAVMIIESVVKEPDSYQDCGSYLGDLFGASNNINEMTVQPYEKKSKDRYSY